MPIYKQNKKKDGLTQYKVVVNYTDEKGEHKYKSKRVYGKDEAALTEMKLKLELNNETPTKKITIEVLFSEFLEAKKHEVRKSTLGKCERILKRHILPYFKNVKIADLNVIKLQNWKNTVNSLSLKIKTKKNIYSEFRSLLNFAVKMEYISSNPLIKVGNFKDALDISKPKDVLQYYTAEQFKTFITFAETQCNTLNAWGLYVFFYIAFFTGMRKGEINALKWTDIEGDILHVRRSVDLKQKGVLVAETPPKNKASYRDLQMPKQLIQILEEHKKRQQTVKGFKKDFRICGGIKCLSDTSISNFNVKCAKATDLPHIRIHDYRHTHASLLANEGINIQEVARRLGHSNVKQTWDTYAHLYPREEERAIKVLEDIKI